jgi:hypothetical protein
MTFSWIPLNIVILDANHRELLAALERLATRINALEAGFARLDERTRKQPCTSIHWDRT